MNSNFNNGTNPSSPPPSISLTPSNSYKNTGQSRSRSGTLPSSFLSAGGAMGNAGSLLEENDAMTNSTGSLAKSYNSESLCLPTMDSISLAVSSSPNSQAVDIPNGGNSNSRRMRSGSLFSTNSIWNDDTLSLHSPSHTGTNMLDNFDLNSTAPNANDNNGSTNGNNSFISPVLNAQKSTVSHHNDTNPSSTPTSANNNVNMDTTNNQRYRSYTTTAAVPNVSSSSISLSSNSYSMDPMNSNMMSNSPFTPNKTNDINALLDNLMINMNHPNSNNTRHRSQTYSGTTPVLHESSIQLQLPHQQQHQEQLLAQNLFQQNPQQHTNQVLGQKPLLQDDFVLSQLMITTSFENPKLGPTKNILFDNLPQFIDSVKLWSLLNNSLGNNRSLGSIKSVRISSTSTSKLALIECTSVDLAMTLKASFNHLELVPGVVLYVAFAKFVENSNGSATSNEASYTSGNPSSTTPLQSSSLKNGGVRSVHETSKPSPTDLLSIQENLIAAINRLSSSSKVVDLNKIVSIISKSISYPNENYQDNFGPLPDPIPLRQFDSPKLRELRKILENSEQLPSQASGANNASDSEDNEISNKVMSQLELEELCLAMLDELPELCYDYLGNTIVQKIFAVVESPLIKLMMVKEITPFLTQLSIHKNGTWAIQKIINLCNEDYQQKYLIGASLKPYAVKLFNDQFGNYVLQGCLKFSSPFNDFMFETMLDNFLEISFGRFGARCIRTILETANESDVISNEQVILVAGLIVEFANELVVNNNGSLLITWFLDTFNGCGASKDNRFELLTEKFLPNLEKLCTHKLANLTILKILNNRSDLNLKQIIMDSIFGKFEESEDDFNRPPSKLLEFILSENQENSAGPLFVYKILSNPLMLTVNDENDSDKNSKYQQFIIQQIRRILLEVNVTNFQAYKKLMDEVGLSTTRLNRSTSIGSRRSKRGGRANSNSNKVPLAQSQVSQQHIINPMGYLVGQGVPVQNAYAGHHYALPPQISQHQQQHHQHQPQQQGYPMMMPPQMMMSMTNQPQTNIGQQQHAAQPQQLNQQQQHDMAVMQQLEQLSLSSAALGYNSNPGTPGVSTGQRNLFF